MQYLVRSDSTLGKLIEKERNLYYEEIKKRKLKEYNKSVITHNILRCKELR